MATEGRGDRLTVVALDLGTTFSGYAFSHRSDFQINPMKILSNDWSAEGVHNAELKAPSVLLLNPDQSFKAFGYRAQSEYGNLVEEEREVAAEYYYVKNFKMQLHNMEISLDMDIKDNTGKSVKAIKVFTESIRFLKDHFLTMFTSHGLGVFQPSDVLFVITVPAIWSDAAKQFMRVASEKAGIDSSQMILAYEPEAAALYCSLLPEDHGIAKYFQVGRRLMIVDLGGGTADITVIKVIKREEKLTYIEHVYRVTGGAWGGNQVNMNYENFLEKVFGNDVMKKFRKEQFHLYLEMMKDFEVQKKTLSVAGDKKYVSVKISGELSEIYAEKHNGKRIKTILQEQLSDKVKIVGDKLKFEAPIFKRFFQDCVKEIVQHINETFAKRGCAFPSAMILVGGFSDSPVIRDEIKNAFPVIKDVVSPIASSLAVLKGSVVFGHKPSIVTGRVCRETLGISLHRDLVPDAKGNRKSTIKIDGSIHQDKSFLKMFAVNEIVKLGQIRSVDIEDNHQDKESRRHPKVVEVFASQNEEPKYITDEGCVLRGKVTVHPPDGEWSKSAEGSIEMEAGGTEIIVRYRDKKTEQVTEEKIDFM